VLRRRESPQGPGRGGPSPSALNRESLLGPSVRHPSASSVFVAYGLRREPFAQQGGCDGRRVRGAPRFFVEKVNPVADAGGGGDGGIVAYFAAPVTASGALVAGACGGCTSPRPERRTPARIARPLRPARGLPGALCWLGAGTCSSGGGDRPVACLQPPGPSCAGRASVHENRIRTQPGPGWRRRRQDGMDTRPGRLSIGLLQGRRASGPLAGMTGAVSRSSRVNYRGLRAKQRRRRRFLAGRLPSWAAANGAKGPLDGGGPGRPASTRPELFRQRGRDHERAGLTRTASHSSSLNHPRTAPPLPSFDRSRHRALQRTMPPDGRLARILGALLRPAHLTSAAPA